jgi:hypothetical protein
LGKKFTIQIATEGEGTETKIYIIFLIYHGLFLLRLSKAKKGKQK